MSFRTILSTDKARARAIELIVGAPDGWVAELREPKRTRDQNDKMWAMLTDISQAQPGGQRYTPDEWKPRIMHACGFECQFLPGILDGHPFPVGFKSSELTKAQMAALINWMQAWGDEQGVRWTDPEAKAIEAQRAETVKHGSVHESAAPKGFAQKDSTP